MLKKNSALKSKIKTKIEQIYCGFCGKLPVRNYLCGDCLEDMYLKSKERSSDEQPNHSIRIKRK